MAHHGVNRDGSKAAPQAPNSPEDVFGGRAQIQDLRAIDAPDAVVLSIGGNDAGFAEIGSGWRYRRHATAGARRSLD